MKIYIDIETYCETPIKLGVYKYAEKAELLLFAYTYDKGPVEVIDCVNDKNGISNVKRILREGIRYNHTFVAHNAQFERVLLKATCGITIPTNLIQCTMVKALAHSLPGSLDKLCEIFRLGNDVAKDKKGKELINTFCKPRKVTRKKISSFVRTYPKDEPKLWGLFIDYNRKDVLAERELDRLIPSWNSIPVEKELYILDQKINDRGYLVDIEMSKCAVESVRIGKQENDSKTQNLTDNVIRSATQRDALLKYILGNFNVDLPDMRSSTLERRLLDDNLPDDVKELLRLRLFSSGTSTKKYTTLIDCASSDNRLRGTLQFLGASRTGRWNGKIFQPLNLPRPAYKKEEIEFIIKCIRLGCVDLIYTDVNKAVSSCIRGAIIAPKGKKFVISDLSSIEGRGIAYLAGEGWKLDAYRNYDSGNGYDMYVLTYSKSFNVPPESVTPDQRQLGKVLELALGYGGGVGAFITFAAVYGIDLNVMANNVHSSIPKDVYLESSDFYEYCLDKKKTYSLDEETFIACDSLKRMWRRGNPKIVRFWYDLENSVKSVLNKEVRSCKCGRLTVSKHGNWLTIKLPSGRSLCYPSPRLEDNKIKYLGVNTYSHKWGYISTYGGKLAENVVQAFCRDILASCMLRAESKGYEVVLCVHDEIISETPDTKEFTHSELSKMMSLEPVYAKGIPLAAAGFEAYLYGKDK